MHLVLMLVPVISSISRAVKKHEKSTLSFTSMSQAKAPSLETLNFVSNISGSEKTYTSV